VSFERLRHLLESRLDRQLGKGASEPEIIVAEKRLGIGLHGEYRDFLRTFGWGGAADIEIFGLGADVPPYLDVVRIAESERTEMATNLPVALVPIMNDGGGNLYCIDTRSDEPTVVFWDHEAGSLQRPSVASATFSDWLMGYLTN
jgi:hypothetical protein